MHAPHLLRLVLSQVVVDGDDVHALAFQGVQVRRHQRHDRLALAGLHLGDVGFVQGDATDQLHIEGTLAQHAAGGFPDGGESLGKQLVEALTVVEALLQVGGLSSQFAVVHREVVVLDAVDLVRDPLHPLQDASLASVEQAVHETHRSSPLLILAAGRTRCAPTLQQQPSYDAGGKGFTSCAQLFASCSAGTCVDARRPHCLYASSSTARWMTP